MAFDDIFKGQFNEEELFERVSVLERVETGSAWVEECAIFGRGAHHKWGGRSDPELQVRFA